MTLKEFFKYFFAYFRKLFLWRERKINFKQRIKSGDLSLRSRWPHDVTPSRLWEGVSVSTVTLNEVKGLLFLY